MKLRKERLDVLRRNPRIKIVKDVAGLVTIEDVNPNPIRKQKKRFSFYRRKT